MAPETLSGEQAPLSRLRRGCGPKVGKFYFAMEAFESVVLPLLEPNKAIKLHVIDEVCEASITYISESCFTKDLHWRTIDMDICDRRAHLTMSALLLCFFLWVNF
jgi:hypothetical protein